MSDDDEAVRASLMEADRAWSEAVAASGAALDAFGAPMVDDVRVLAPDLPIARGRDASLAVFAALRELPGFSLSWSATEAIGSAGGGVGVTLGSYHMGWRDADGQPVSVDGKYLTVWTRRADGSWGVAADMFNADGPPTSMR